MRENYATAARPFVPNNQQRHHFRNDFSKSAFNFRAPENG
jgi:hypothetical protein